MSSGLLLCKHNLEQFGQQEAGTPEQIQQFVTKRYSVTFPMFSKIDVNGQDEEPLFTYLKSAVDKSSIQWNFTKYLGACLHDAAFEFFTYLLLLNHKAQNEMLCLHVIDACVYAKL
jgi:Glutathione peroxidase